MKKLDRIVALLLVLCLFALPVMAEELDYEGGIETIAPDIELASNPTTGYHWFYTCDDTEVVDVVENGFVSENDQLLGAPGKECFRLNSQQAGFAVVTFSYARTAEEEPMYAIEYHIVVDEELNVMIFETSFVTK